MNPNVFHYSIAHGHIFGFRDKYWDYTLSFIIPSDDSSFKEKTVPDNQISIVNVTSIAIVCISYHAKFSILYYSCIFKQKILIIGFFF